MNNLSDIAKFEKNQMYPDSVFLLLMDIKLTDGDTVLHIAYNNDSVHWKGYDYNPFPVDIPDTSQNTDGTIPNIEIKVSNVTKSLMGYFEQYSGFNNSLITMYVVNSKNLASSTPEIEEQFKVLKGTADENWLTFTCGPSYSPDSKMPQRRYLKNGCQFCYKSARCGYVGTLPTCDHSYGDCKKHGNERRYGGFPGIDQGGIYD